MTLENQRHTGIVAKKVTIQVDAGNFPGHSL